MGGKACGLKTRAAAMARYYLNPNMCIHCGNVIDVGNHKVTDMRKRKFCTQTCAGHYNNPVAPRYRQPRHCKECGRQAVRGSFCSTACRVKEANCLRGTITKGELFAKRKNWQSARSTIQKLARSAFERAHPRMSCNVCGYTNHVEVAHRKQVSDFDNNATVNEINHITNLVGLCPNHHWELDHGLIELAPHAGIEPAAPTFGGSGPSIG